MLSSNGTAESHPLPKDSGIILEERIERLNEPEGANICSEIVFAHTCEVTASGAACRRLTQNQANRNPSMDGNGLINSHL